MSQQGKAEKNDEGDYLFDALSECWEHGRPDCVSGGERHVMAYTPPADTHDPLNAIAPPLAAAGHRVRGRRRVFAARQQVGRIEHPGLIRQLPT